MTIVLMLYEEIHTGAAGDVVARLQADPGADVEVRINSPGGSVADGIAIYNALKPRKPTVYIDGIAASIASLIAMAGDRIYAAENALLMVHDPWVMGTHGNSRELRRTADLLDKHRDAMLGAYTRSGLSRSELEALLAAETWMTAEEALDLGFVDEISQPLRYAAHAATCFSRYRNTPKELLMNTNARRTVRGADPQNPDPQNPDPSLEPADDKKTLDAFKKGMASDAVSKAAHDAVMQALRERNETIAAMGAPYMESNQAIRAYTITALSDPTVTPEEYGQRVLGILGRDCEPLGGAVRIDGYGRHVVNGVPDGSLSIRASGGHAAGGDFARAACDALAIRAGIKVDKPHPGTRDVQGMTLSEIMHACVRRSGRSVDLGAGSGGGLVRAALSTSDFPAILENSLGKALRSGFEAEPATFEAWTRKVMVPDFKPQARPIIGSAPGLLPVLEGAEYTFGALDEDKAKPYSVAKFGRLVRLTWEAMVNDDLGAFLRMTQALGQAAARAEGDAIYAGFTENAGAGPTMQDGATLFHASHGNLAAAAAVDAAGLGKARVLLRRQTAVGGGVLNLTPRYLLVAPEHEQAAETLLAAAARSLSQGSANELVPAWLAKLELVVEARLAATAFYLLTSPESVDTYERAWLEADNGPVIAEEDGFNTDAKTYKVRHVFGGRWLDWRGAVKVPIA